jgi:predicted Ser/Thr protein kinase
MNDDSVLERANDELSKGVEEPIDFEEFVDRVFANPCIAASAAQFILNAIESMGTRPVMEGGEEVERYKFFDDPANNGKHAIIGNSRTLNDIVSHIRRAANGKDTKIVWLTGPTATGKSELKRCIVNGLREYSQTEEGKRYVCEWNISALDESDYKSTVDEDEWYKSPVQTNPIACLPSKTRNEFVEELNKNSDQRVPDLNLDPFSKEAFRVLKEHYSTRDEENIFTKLIDTDHLRVRRYTVDWGNGIGVLHSEDSGQPKERLAGSWLPSLLQELPSKGRRNPQAFSYDGVLSQGNNGVSIIEDASQHIDVLEKLLNVPEENEIRIDKQTALDLDTFIILISNPDLEAQLNKHEGQGKHDPFKAFKRRLDKYEFKYLISVSSEAELLRRELTGRKFSKWGEDYERRMEEPLEVNDTFFEPHTIEVIAMASVVSRLLSSTETDPIQLSVIEKALLYERGYHETEDGEEKYVEDYSVEPERDGREGIPVTLTRDMLLTMENDGSVLPMEALDELGKVVQEEPVVSEREASRMSSREGDVREYMMEKLEDDVKKAILRERSVDEEDAQEYIKSLEEWEADKNEPQKEKEDRRLRLKVFETRHLGLTEDNYMKGNKGKKTVIDKREEIMNSIRHYLWKNKDERYEASDLPLKDIPIVNEMLGVYKWEDIEEKFDDLELKDWDDPLDGTQTSEVKETCVQNMVQMYGYTEDGAKQVSNRVIDRVLARWD